MSIFSQAAPYSIQHFPGKGHPITGEPGWDQLVVQAGAPEVLALLLKSAEAKAWRVWAREDADLQASLYKPSGVSETWADPSCPGCSETEAEFEARTAAPGKAAAPEFSLEGQGRPYVVHTDGARKGSGAGGWGALLERPDGTTQELYGGERDTTNNRMELMAAIKGLQAIPRGATVELTTDSQYVQKGISEWIPGWKRRNWQTADGKPVKNKDLWELLDAEARAHKVSWHWVRGHNGHPENERADYLANLGAASAS